MLAATDRTSEAFNLAVESASILDQVISQVFSTGSESQRLAYLERIRHFTYLLLSLTQRCSDSGTATRTAMDLVLRRKAIGAEVLAVQRDTVLGGKYPAPRRQLTKLRTVKRQIAQKMLTGPGLDGVEMYKQHLSEWEAKRESLEAELAREIPEMNLELQLNQTNHRDVARALPEGTALVEFVQFHFYNFAAVHAHGESSWESPRYLAFVMRARAPETLVMKDLGGASQIDCRSDLSGRELWMTRTSCSLALAAVIKQPMYLVRPFVRQYLTLLFSFILAAPLGFSLRQMANLRGCLLKHSATAVEQT